MEASCRVVPSLELSRQGSPKQDYVCRQPERYESLADEIAEQVASQPTVSFSWLRAARGLISAFRPLATPSKWVMIPSIDRFRPFAGG